jgi:hypothetical protein
MGEKPTNTPIIHSFSLLIMYGSMVHEMHHVTRHNMPIHNILLTAPQFGFSQNARGMLPEDGNVMLKHVGATIHN